uniref:Mobilization protein n=1 Tax=Heterorhabditis bacteriophora TaxID=37862 RepID=A0A1I7WXE9_HETBA
MYIKRIEIDGFKSYAQKQVVDKFDEQFNAITGEYNYHNLYSFLNTDLIINNQKLSKLFYICGYSATRTQLSEITTEVKKAEMKQKQLQPALVRKQKELENLTKQNTSESRELQQREHEVNRCEVELAKLGFDEEREIQMRDELQKHRDHYHQLQVKVNSLHQRHARIDFVYRDPKPTFDRSSVKGTLATLFRVKDTKYALALEIAAGAYYN